MHLYSSMVEANKQRTYSTSTESAASEMQHFPNRTRKRDSIHRNHSSETHLAFGYPVIRLGNVVELVDFFYDLHLTFGCDVERLIEILRAVLRRSDQPHFLEHQLGRVIQRLVTHSHQNDSTVGTHASGCVSRSRP